MAEVRTIASALNDEEDQNSISNEEMDETPLELELDEMRVHDCCLSVAELIQMKSGKSCT